MGICFFEVDTGLPSEGKVFADRSKEKRSGHISHALVEYKKDCILAFYSNNLVLEQQDGSERVLIQAFISWGGPWQVNVNHWWLTIK